MFKELTKFCRQANSQIALTTLDYLERFSKVDGATVAEIAENANEKAAIRKMLRSHKPWFRFKETDGQDYQGRPGRRVFLTKKGKQFLYDAKIAYKQGLIEDD